MDREPDAIANAGGEYCRVPAIGIERQHIGAIGFAPRLCAKWKPGSSHPAAGLAMPSATLLPEPTEIASAAVPAEHDIARRMAGSMRQIGDDGFGCAVALRSPAAIGKAHHAIGVGDINPFGFTRARKEGDAKRLMQAAGIDLGRRRLLRAIGRAQHLDPAGAGLRDEDIAVRRHAHDARPAQPLGKQIDRKTI